MSGPIEAAFLAIRAIVRYATRYKAIFNALLKVSANRRIDLLSSELQDNCLKTLFTFSRFHSQK